MHACVRACVCEDGGNVVCTAKKRKQTGRCGIWGLGTCCFTVREGGHIWEESIPGREDGKYKGPKAGSYLEITQ